MRLPPALCRRSAILLRQRPELWGMAPSGIDDAERFIAHAIGKPAGDR